MFHEKDHINNPLGAIIFIALTLLVFSFFSDKTVEKINSIPRHELSSGMHSDQVDAIVAETIYVPAFQKSYVLPLHNLFNETDKIVADNHKINSGIKVLQKYRLSIKPVMRSRLLCLQFAEDDEDSPVLS